MYTVNNKGSKKRCMGDDMQPCALRKLAAWCLPSKIKHSFVVATYVFPRYENRWLKEGNDNASV